MELSKEQIVDLLEPLTHKRMGKIDFSDPKIFENYWKVLAGFGYISDDTIDHQGELKHFYADALHGQHRQWYLSRGKIQSISYKCNRVEENARRLMRRFREQCPVQWVWEVHDESRWGDVIGYIVSNENERDAEKMAAMMYHTSKSVEVVRVKPLFNVSNFLESQQKAQKKIQKKIDRCLEGIAEMEKKIEGYQAQLCDIVTNSVCFSGEN